ncbi:hypothetical protein [Mycoplasma sp. ATU-Cv-703]|uniref:hypothetical protein n=1 Tax=Mycoplasma sp. ATU-Cv-703 TaxID=2498595 RepID=UPI000FDD00A7
MAFNNSEVGQNAMGFFWGVIAANILFLLLYVLPLMIVKNPNTLKIWAIVWIVLSALSLISAIVNIVNTSTGLVSGILGSLNAIFILVGSIMIVANARNYRY